MRWRRNVAIDVADRQRILHLFRALLRQCTYLPDPVARKYIHSHVVSRFRAYHPNNAVPGKLKKLKPMQWLQQRRPTMIKIAKESLKYLQRANDGHRRHLGKILSMTYGRVGKRRHLLLKNLQLPDVPVEGVAMERSSDPREQDVPHPSQQLLALISSQRRQRLYKFPARKHPTQAPKIPARNHWARPMPVSRVKNMKRRWYAETLSRIMPPLPQEDWDELRKMASGETPWEGPVPRRGPENGTTFKRDLMRYPGLRSSPHNITPRFMRRLWSTTLELCPVMILDATRPFGWKVLWTDAGAARKLTLRYKTAESTAVMFDGVDENGRIVHKRDRIEGWAHTVEDQQPYLSGDWEEPRQWGPVIQ